MLTALPWTYITTRYLDTEVGAITETVDYRQRVVPTSYTERYQYCRPLAAPQINL